MPLLRQLPASWPRFIYARLGVPPAGKSWTDGGMEKRKNRPKLFSLLGFHIMRQGSPDLVHDKL
jgi:hypothetical protein